MTNATKSKRVATVNFINERNCLVTRDWAITVQENKKYYLAESPEFSKREKFSIHSTFYKDVVDDVAALWGVLKVSYKI